MAQDIEGYDKTYIADFELGYKTDTYDSEGKIIAQSQIESVSKEKMLAALEKFKGYIEQVPPMYSAIKVDGKKLYELAREGIEIERAKRPVTIHQIELLEFDGKKGKIECEVSKGTYIRSLIDDIGIELGTYATMTGLDRTKVGKEELEKSYKLEELEELVEKKDFTFLTSIEDYFVYPKTEISQEKDITLFLNGQRVKKDLPDGRYRVYLGEKFLGLGEVQNRLLKGYKYY